MLSEHELWLVCVNGHLDVVEVDGDKAVVQPLKP